MNAAKVPIGPINDIARVFADPQVQARGLHIRPVTPDGQRVQGVASPLNLSATPSIAPRAAPALGADTLAVLSGLLPGQDFDLARLLAEGVIATTPT